MKTIKIETWAPLFTGFYHSLFDGDDSIDQFLHENDTEWDNIEFDGKSYREDVSKEVCDALEDMLEGYVSKITYQNLHSPKYYNFSTDSINIEVELSEKNIEAISNYIYDHKEEFQTWLKDNYTSCDGFISFHSNEFEEWETDLKAFTHFEDDKHKLGSILDFILKNEEQDELSLYYAVFDGGGCVYAEMYCTLKEEE